MKKPSTIVATLVFCFVITTGIFAQKRSTPPVYLNVQIDDGVSQQFYGIGSDGLSGGVYSHGVESVTAQFTQYGYLDFNSGSRVVNAYYSTPLDSSSNTLPASDSKTGVVMKTHGGSNYLQNMTVGEIRCVQTSVTFNLGTYSRTIGYNAGHGTISNTSYVKVTHPDTNTWVMESASTNSCTSQDGNTYDSTARIRDRKTSGKSAPDIDYGRYYMPLRLVLTRK